MGSWKSLAPLPRLSNLFWLVKEPFLDGKQLTFPLSQPSSNRRPSPSSTQIPAASDPQIPSAFGIQASGSQSSHQGPGWPHAAGQEVRASRVELGISTMHLNNHRLSQQPSIYPTNHVNHLSRSVFFLFFLIVNGILNILIYI